MIKFSIVMPFYNSEDYIEKSILSVVKQTYNNWELIAVNDGSQDGSLSIVAKYANNDKRIKIISKENGGYSTAVNLGLDNLSADSDYFLMLGSDDELVVDLLEKISQKIADYFYDIIGFRTIRLYENECCEYDKQSFIKEDIREKGVTVNDFYKKHFDAFPGEQLFFVRDTSRCFKTRLLDNLRYFGKYGISADGIFSMLFSYKCSSFAHFAIDGYIWHVRKNSLSQIKLYDEFKLADNLTNWTSFFQVVINNSYSLDQYAIRYIFYYMELLLMMIRSTRGTYRKHHKDILYARKIIFKLTKDYHIIITGKTKICIKTPILYRIYKRVTCVIMKLL